MMALQKNSRPGFHQGDRGTNGAGGATSNPNNTSKYPKSQTAHQELISTLYDLACAIEATPMCTEHAGAVRVRGPHFDLNTDASNVIKLTASLEQDVCHVRAWYDSERKPMACYTVSQPFSVEWEGLQ